MEIKPQNLTKMSKEQLYNLLIDKSLSDADRGKVKTELVKREADDLFKQSARNRGADSPSKPLPTAKKAPGQSAPKKFKISPAVWLYLIFLVAVIAFVLYTTLNK